MVRPILLGIAISAVFTIPAYAACTATVTETVAALEDSSSSLEPGDDFGTPTQLQVYPGDQTSFVCAHGSYCYPSGPIVLNGCRIVAEPDPSASGDPSEPVIFMLRAE